MDSPIELAARADWQLSLAELVGRRVAPALVPLAGGALHRHWRIDVPGAGGVERFVLRRTASRVLDSLSRPAEFAVQRAAFAAGVPAPEPLACGADFLIMRYVPGSAEPAAVLAIRDPDAVARSLAEALARLHHVAPARTALPALAPPPRDPAAAAIAAYRQALDRRPRAHPVLEWGLRALECAPPEPREVALCHGDFRVGNFLVDGDRLSALLDWEFARWSDPYEDLGWFCTRYKGMAWGLAWQGEPTERAAGGMVAREAFFAQYARATGRGVDRRRALYWELMANVRWALIGLAQADRGLAEGLLERALSGRRLAELEAEILTLTEQWLDGDA
jgi:aminoglycoside phosphotransferase (APT) family kinase protein